MSTLHFLQSSADPSCKLAVRACLPTKPAKTVILLLHGATLPSIIFDIVVTNGQSMLSHFANHGLAAYALDYRGYGLSSKPESMDDPTMAGTPLINHRDAALDVYDVIKFIKQQHGDKPLILCGFSWGSGIAGYIASTTNLPTKLILLGPVYSYKNPQWIELVDPNDVTKLNPSIKSYRVASRNHWCSLWDREVAGKDWREPKVLENLLDQIENSDQAWAMKVGKSGCIRIPTGVLADACRVYNQNPIYDAAKISCPTLVLRGEQDTASTSLDMAGLFNNLICPKCHVDIANASHYGILEYEAGRFFTEMINFIQNPG